MKSWKLVLGSTLSFAVVTHAVEPDGILLDSGIAVYPSVELSVEDNDNIYLQPEANQESSTVTRLAPAIALAADLGQTKLGLGFEAEKGTYSADENDNYTDTRMRAGADFDLTARHQLTLSARLNSLHDARGAGTFEGADALEVEDPDEYDETIWNGDFTYGSDGALFNMTFGLNRYEKEYKNNLNVAATNNRDHVKTTLSVETAIYMSDRSNFLIDLSTADIDYNKDNIITRGREGSVQRALLGASYDISGKLTSSAKVGVSQRNFDESDVDSDTTASWNIDVVWTPRTYSKVSLYTAQTANEAVRFGNYIETKYSAVSWEHEFSEYFSLTATASLANDTYYNEDDDREDETLSYGLKGTYSPIRKVDIYGSLKQTERDSTTDGLDYDQEVVTLGVALAI
jgi:hypothetical protein